MVDDLDELRLDAPRAAPRIGAWLVVLLGLLCGVVAVAALVVGGLGGDAELAAAGFFGAVWLIGSGVGSAHAGRPGAAAVQPTADGLTFPGTT